MVKLPSKSWLHAHALKAALLASVLAASVISVYAYLQLNGRANSTRAVTTEYPRELSITLEKTTFKTGELVHVNLTLKNIGNETLTHKWSLLVGFDFDVFDANGTWIYGFVAAHLALFDLKASVLEPGKEFTFTLLEWNQTRLIIENDTIYGEASVTAGVYKIVGKLDGWNYDNVRIQQITTPSLTITLTEAD